jgi:hypothetical protein
MDGEEDATWDRRRLQIFITAKKHYKQKLWTEIGQGT